MPRRPSQEGNVVGVSPFESVFIRVYLWLKRIEVWLVEIFADGRPARPYLTDSPTAVGNWSPVSAYP